MASDFGSTRSDPLCVMQLLYLLLGLLLAHLPQLLPSVKAAWIWPCTRNGGDQALRGFMFAHRCGLCFKRSGRLYGADGHRREHANDHAQGRRHHSRNSRNADIGRDHHRGSDISTSAVRKSFRRKTSRLEWALWALSGPLFWPFLDFEASECGQEANWTPGRAYLAWRLLP